MLQNRFKYVLGQVLLQGTMLKNRFKSWAIVLLKGIYYKTYINPAFFLRDSVPCNTDRNLAASSSEQNGTDERSKSCGKLYLT